MRAILPEAFLSSRMQSFISKIARFGVVGGAAAATHWIAVTAIVTATRGNPLLVNVLGFLMALSVSYFGHKNWTFNAQDKNHTDTLPKFTAIAVAGFCINEAVLTVLFQGFKMDYRISLFVAISIAAVSTYVFSSVWAFSKPRVS